MTFKTHLTFGALFVVSPALIPGNEEWMPTLFKLAPFVVPLTFVGSLFPDLDHKDSYISKSPLFIFTLFFMMFGITHRGITHTFFFNALFAGMIYAITTHISFLKEYSVFLTEVGALAFLSHLIADSITKSGVNFLYPFSKKRFNTVPSLMRIKTGTPPEQVYFFGALFATTAVLFIAAPL